MIITKEALSRRTVLKALGVTLPLPLLDAMVPAATALARTPAKPAMRFGAVYVPNGVIPGQWFPATEGSGFEFSKTLKPLEPFRDRLLIVINSTLEDMKTIRFVIDTNLLSVFRRQGIEVLTHGLFL